MKCTDFASLAGKMGRRLQGELAAAVSAHGGKYVFFDPDGEKNFNPYDLPVIRATSANLVDEKYCAVTRVVKDDKREGHTIIYGYPEISDGWYDEDEYVLDEISGFDLQTIIEAIPETATVRSVKIPFPLDLVPVPVLWVDKDDIEHAGFSTENMTDETCYEIGQMVMNKLPLDDYWDTLREACRYYDIPELNEEDEEDEMCQCDN